jgi:cytochrome c oxidase subunit 1
VAAAIEGHGGGIGVLQARGTFTMAMVFLVAFVLYYFINWKYLGSVWGLS